MLLAHSCLSCSMWFGILTPICLKNGLRRLRLISSAYFNSTREQFIIPCPDIFNRCHKLRSKILLDRISIQAVISKINFLAINHKVGFFLNELRFQCVMINWRCNQALPTRAKTPPTKLNEQWRPFFPLLGTYQRVRLF